MGRALRPPLAWVGRAWGFVPLSVGGVLAGVGAGWVFRAYGQAESDFVLQSAGLVVLAVLAAAVLCVGLAGLRLYLGVREPARAHLEGDVDAGFELRTGFSLPALRWWPIVNVEMTWRLPEAVEVTTALDGGRLWERVTPHGRGRHPIIERVFVVRDIFGLARLRFGLRAPAHLRVAPAPTSSQVAIALRHASGEGYAHPSGQLEGDLVEMRRYAPGDPQRMILWRAYARSRRLLVRMPERAIAPQPSAVACFVAGVDDEPTASTARMFIEQGLLGADFTFVADGDGKAVHTNDEALERVIDSAHHRAESGQRLRTLAREHDRAQLTNCVIFVPGAPGPWLDHLAGIMTELPAPPTVVLAVDGQLDAGRHRARRLLLRDEAPRATLRHLPPLYDRLVALGATVWVVHRPSGTAVDATRIDALRAA